MLAYKDKFLHAVSILIIPIAVDTRVVDAELLQFLFRHSSIPLSGILKLHLTASLFEDVAEMRLVSKPTQSLGTNDILRPFASHEVIELYNIKRLARIIYIGADAIFLCLTSFLVMMMVMMTTGALTSMM